MRRDQGEDPRERRPRWGEAMVALLILAAALVIGVLYRFMAVLLKCGPEDELLKVRPGVVPDRRPVGVHRLLQAVQRMHLRACTRRRFSRSGPAAHPYFIWALGLRSGQPVKRATLVLLIGLVAGLSMLTGGDLLQELALRSCVAAELTLSAQLALIGAVVSIGSSLGLAYVTHGRKRLAVIGLTAVLAILAFVAVTGFIFGLCGSF